MKTLGRLSKTTQTTPNGTRTFLIVMPLGRSRVHSSSPTGSGSVAMWRTPSTIDWNRASVSMRRSTIAGASPFAFAFATSTAFAALMSAAFFSSADAIASSAAFFSSVESFASSPAAARARTAMS